MFIWTLSQTLGQPEDPDWEDLVKLSFDAPVHPQRKKKFLLSRESLRICLLKAGITIPIKDLILKNFNALEKFPELTISLSDSLDFGAALIASRSDFVSVGIDIEPTNRQVKDSIHERIKNPKDLKAHKIELWTLKEAVFKALMNSGNFNQPVEFSSIVILENTWLHPDSGLNGSWELHLQDSMIVSCAFIKK